MEGFSTKVKCKLADDTCHYAHTHVAHRQQALVKEEDNAQEGEQEPEAGEAHANFCRTVRGTLTLDNNTPGIPH
jgi:hypothetical protein